MGNYHVPFWRAVEGATPSLTLIEIGISEQAAGKYIPRLLFENFNRQIQRSYLYELIDQGNDLGDDQGRYGLLKNDGSPKPAFTTIKNITSLLKDSGKPIQPHSLDYKLSGDTQGIHSTLLQKSDGAFFLVLWQDAKSWDNESKKDIAVASKNVKISLISASKLEVYDPSKSDKATKTVSAQDITLPVPDFPIILKVTGSTDQPSNTNPQPKSSVSVEDTSQPDKKHSSQNNQQQNNQQTKPSVQPSNQKEPQPEGDSEEPVQSEQPPPQSEVEPTESEQPPPQSETE